LKDVNRVDVVVVWIGSVIDCPDGEKEAIHLILGDGTRHGRQHGHREVGLEVKRTCTSRYTKLSQTIDAQNGFKQDASATEEVALVKEMRLEMPG
jgi:hypothetical protein